MDTPLSPGPPVEADQRLETTGAGWQCERHSTLAVHSDSTIMHSSRQGHIVSRDATVNRQGPVHVQVGNVPVVLRLQVREPGPAALVIFESPYVLYWD